MTKRIATIVMSGLTLIAGCGRDEIIPVDAVQPPDAPRPVDARTADAAPRICTAADGTADVTVTGGGGGTVHYGRLHAGAVLEVGPVAAAPGPAAPMTIQVMFTDVSPIDADTAGCCIGGVDSCCGGTVALTAFAASIAVGAEVGDHAVTFTKSNDLTYMVDGLLTITTFDDPFPTAPGRVAGSVTGSMAGRTVTGTFDHAFCPSLLTATI